MNIRPKYRNYIKVGHIQKVKYSTCIFIKMADSILYGLCKKNKSWLWKNSNIWDVPGGIAIATNVGSE